jgi:hypothetical protein
MEAIFGSELQSIPAVINVPANPQSGGVAWVVVVEAARVPEAGTQEVKGAVARQYEVLERAQLQDTLERWLSMKRESADVELFRERLTKSESR